jgi:hypothetical protein
MLQSPVYVSEIENNVLDLASFIKFGELEGVELSEEGREVRKELSPRQQRFIDLIRTEEYTHLDRIVVHEGVPATLELRGERHGIKYKIKRKI